MPNYHCSSIQKRRIEVTISCRITCMSAFKIDNLHVRPVFDLGKKVNFRKELIKISKIAKFGNLKCCKIRKI